ncbi:Ictacalcin [Collichthys lucidus]|uniref:Protein S100 n=1 Tax=Collichthys lucidus TaxID=240159 RepID=A0A4U5V2V9_COLLU|nr:Ictacalcin [Collichthys lucidus]
MSDLTKALAMLQATFDKYAGKDGDSNTLSKAELADLLHKELPFGESIDKAKVDNFFSMLDNDKDGVVDFTEYVTFVTALGVMCRGK